MKLSALILAATLGVASAAPISLIYITNTGRTIIRTSPPPESFQPLANIRFGHAAAYAQPNSVPGTTVTSTRTHSGCGGLRAKMDKVREMFGLTPIVREEEFHIMPVPHPYDPIRDGGREGKVTMMRWHTVPAGLPDGMVGTLPFPPPHYRIREQSFGDRIHRALNQLGPWEGRAVTFVLGCGLGVLLRMFFVLGVLLVRARRQQPIELPVESQIIFVAPPQYIIEEGTIPVTDEKAPIYEEVAPELLVDLDAKKDGDVSA